MNGDGYSDVIVGAFEYSSETGRAYVYSEGLMEHFNDVGVSSIVQPVLNSIYNFDCINGSNITPFIKVSNFGSNDQLNYFDVFCEIKHGNNVVYFNSKQDTISARQSHMLSFDPFVITNYFYDEDLTKTYSIKSWTSLSNDVNNYNDTVNSTFKASNPNYGYSDESGYYALNSSQAASCIPEQPSYSWEDTTGSVSLIVNAQPVVPYTQYNSFYFCGSFRLPDVLPGGRKFKFFGTCYDTIIIANNGVIGFGDASLSRMNVPFPETIPSVNAPHPAIFPLWYWVNYQDPEITGRNLKYKITDDKFIITYDRIPLYNATIDPNDYVTYQVILETDVDCSSENGNIKVQYNYDKCGSTFINHYNNNELNEMTVGLQNSTGTIALQYRRSESNHTVTVPGPLFGSPLAVEFAQVNSVLPVDLQAFTSTVNKNNVVLNWSVNSELNNSGFEIQRRKSESESGSEWIKINFVNGRGNSSEPNNYSYEDKNLYHGKYEYRLKQIDYNGSFKYYDLQNEVVIGIPEKIPAWTKLS
ncbi:MAG: FG-GAP repeat protein [Ignavibacteria bacterium]|nr:FG-GAP repeat protein [Ignavibacteria bacterium]